MSRAFVPLIQLLHEYHPPDAWELECKERMIAFIKGHPDCFERTLTIGHITASAFVLNKEGNKALLMHHAKLHKWVQLGGHCDGNPDVLAVAIKEAQEESGIQAIIQVSDAIFDLDIHTIPARVNEPEHDHYDVRFLLRLVSDEPFVVNRESKELRWIDKYAPLTVPCEPSVVRMIRKWQEL